MSEAYGKDVVFKLGGANVICFRTIGVTFNGDDIDLSDSCSDGFREIARNPAMRSIDFAVTGVAKSAFLRNAVLTPDGRYFVGGTIEWPPQGVGMTVGDKITGDFYLSDYSEDVPYDNVLTFSGTLKTSGAYVYAVEHV